MIPVTQTHTGVRNPRANCLMAAVASIVECPIESLPDVFEHEEKGVAWYKVLADALAPHGLVPIIYDQASPLFPPIAPKGYHVACGWSPRQDEQHAVVALDGQVVFDPHPSRDGLRGEIGWWILLVPAAKSPVDSRADIGPGAR